MKNLLILLLCGIVVIVGIVIVMDRIEARERAIAQRETEAREAAEAAEAATREAAGKAELFRAKQRQIAKEREAARLRLLAEIKAKQAKLLAEQKRFEEANRLKTLPERLKLAEEELKQALLDYELLLQKVTELRRTVAIKEAKMKSAQQTANTFERQLTDSRKSKNRAEGQYRSTYYDAGARPPAPKGERELTRKRTRYTTKKAGEAQTLVEKEIIKYEIVKKDLTIAEMKLGNAIAILNSKKYILEKTQKEKKFEGQVLVGVKEP
jgi:hypothetical protein